MVDIKRPPSLEPWQTEKDTADYVLNGLYALAIVFVVPFLLPLWVIGKIAHKMGVWLV